ncbi:MAG: PEP-CTERM sorting domain-containing protein [Akkermansiaceae bacterium]|nr:PEP-CTERM sorting domain-containing protein [Akkermansiaceae bacterium]
MKNKSKKLTTSTLALTALAIGSTQASVINITPIEENGGDRAVAWNPTTTVASNTDLLQGLTATASSGNFALEASGAVPIFNDGSVGTWGAYVDGATNHDNFATGGNTGGTSVTYNLAPSTFGYDITDVIVLGGWQDTGRDQQAYTVAFAPIGDLANFTTVGSVNFQPTITGQNHRAITTGLTDDGGGFIGQGVGAVRFTFDSVENGYTGYAELDVIGSAAVPEPSSTALIGLGGLALLLRRKK